MTESLNAPCYFFLISHLTPHLNSGLFFSLPPDTEIFSMKAVFRDFWALINLTVGFPINFSTKVKSG